jgi:hypothetical protein
MPIFVMLKTGLSYEDYPLCFESGPLDLSCVTANFDKIWSACGQHEIQYTE